MRIAACIPIFGEEELTNKLLVQIAREAPLVDVYLCDNKGDFQVELPRVFTLRQSENLGWLEGTNAAWRAAAESGEEYDAFVLLNNDVVLSEHFFEYLLNAAIENRIGIIGPVYNCARPGQLSEYDGAVADYRGNDKIRRLAIVDGTCMLITRAVFEKIGYLDDSFFSGFGWGADVDYCVRARRAGFRVAASEMAYLSHIGWATAGALCSDYKVVAYREYIDAMRRRYGVFWGRHLELELKRKWWRTKYHFIEVFSPEKIFSSRERWAKKLNPRPRER